MLEIPTWDLLRYAKSDKEAFCNLNAALGKTSIVFRCSAAHLHGLATRRCASGLLPRYSLKSLASNVRVSR